jgi:hypothetical protein
MMGYSENVNVRWKWEVCSQGPMESRWAAMYASINKYGDIIISRVTHEAMGNPDGYQLLYDRERDAVGLKPAKPERDKNAFPARPRGRHGGRRIRGHRLFREFGIELNQTRVFHRCQIDKQGVLILSLGTSRPVGGAGTKGNSYGY